MFERFTDRARRVVVLAQEESRLLQHDCIGTEHFVLALLHDDESDVGRALQQVGLSLEAARGYVEQGRPRGRKASSGHIPFTAHAKQVLDASLRISQRLGGHWVGEAHLLRAILDVPEGAGCHLLVTGFNIDIEALADVADDLARSALSGYEDSVRVTHASAAPRPDRAPISRRMSAHEMAANIAGLADELARRTDRLAAGLRHYGRHLDDCAPDSPAGCTCGFMLLLSDNDAPSDPEQDADTS